MQVLLFKVRHHLPMEFILWWLTVKANEKSWIALSNDTVLNNVHYFYPPISMECICVAFSSWIMKRKQLLTMHWAVNMLAKLDCSWFFKKAVSPSRKQSKMPWNLLQFQKKEASSVLELTLPFQPATNIKFNIFFIFILNLPLKWPKPVSLRQSHISIFYMFLI